MSLKDLQSEFGIAYVRAIAHAAGYYTQESNRLADGDGVDLTVFHRGVGGAVRSPRLDLQIKTTAGTVTQDPIPYDLDVKNHNELISAEWQVPRALVLVVVPPQPDPWVEASEEQLILRRCGYWLSLRGQAATANTTTQRVSLPRAQVFHVQPLRDIMARIQAGGHP